jgi:hypothetical protein
MIAGPEAHILSFPELLVGCGTTVNQDDLLNVRTGSLAVLPRNQTWESLGRYWVEGQQAAPCPTAAGSCEPFYQWHTRATAYVPVTQMHPGGLPVETPAALVLPQTLEPDLDSVGLTIAPPCSPYEHQSVDNSRDAYDPPYVLVASAPLTPVQVAAGQTAHTGLQLGRCGSAKTVTLGRRPVGAELSAGNLSWADGTSAYDYVTATRKTYRWPVPHARASFSPPVSVLHTRYAVLVAKTTRQACSQLCEAIDVDLYLTPLAT